MQPINISGAPFPPSSAASLPLSVACTLHNPLRRPPARSPPPTTISFLLIGLLARSHVAPARPSLPRSAQTPSLGPSYTPLPPSAAARRLSYMCSNAAVAAPKRERAVLSMEREEGKEGRRRRHSNKFLKPPRNGWSERGREGAREGARANDYCGGNEKKQADEGRG